MVETVTLEESDATTLSTPTRHRKMFGMSDAVGDGEGDRDAQSPAPVPAPSAQAFNPTMMQREINNLHSVFITR